MPRERGVRAAPYFSTPSKMAPSRAIARVLIRRLVWIIMCVRWLTSNIRRRRGPSRRGRMSEQLLQRRLSGRGAEHHRHDEAAGDRGRRLDVRALCEEYHDPASGFLVVHYEHAGSRYRAHVRAAVDTSRLLAPDPSTPPILTPPIFARFSKVEMERDGTDVTDVFVASAGPFSDFGGGCARALSPVGRGDHPRRRHPGR